MVAFSFQSLLVLVVTTMIATQMVESFQPIAHRSINIKNSINTNINTNNNNINNINKNSISNMKTNNFENKNSKTSLQMSENNPTKQSNLPMLLDVGTKGGALFLSLLLFIVPIIIYEICTLGLGIDGIEAGKWIGVGFTFFTTVLWVGSYILRVATKDMTYAKQLKDYENAVIAKRLEELDEDEIQALVEDIERDDF